MKVPRGVAAGTLICAVLLALTAGAAPFPPPVTRIASLPGPFSFEGTYGNKVVLTQERFLHAVWENGGVRYSSSADFGATWTAPVLIGAPAARRPVIAASSDGTLGVAYALAGGIYYTAKSRTSGWTVPVFVSLGEEVSIAAFGNRMHLAWASPPYVKYVALQPLATQTPTDIENIDEGTLCGTWIPSIPSIAVTSRSAVDPAPLVRVAFFYTHIPCSHPSDHTAFGYIIAERPIAPAPLWPVVYGGLEFDVDLATYGRVSNSIVFAPGSGDFFAAYSYISNNVGSTTLTRQNAWNPQSAWRQSKILARRSLIDVEARKLEDCTLHFRIAVSDFTQGNGSYGPTWFRTGTWASNQPQPSWEEPAPVQISSRGRNPQALLTSFLSYSGGSRFLRAVFDHLEGSNYELRTDWKLTTSPPGNRPCTPLPPPVVVPAP